MAILPRFESPEDEARYVESSRLARSKATRWLLVLSGGMAVFAASLTPAFSTGESFAAFNVMVLLLIVGFSAAFSIVGTPFYRQNPSIDISVFMLASSCAIYLFWSIHRSTGTPISAIAVMATMALCGSIFVASVAFVANLRFYLLTTCLQAMVFFGFIALVDISGALKLQLSGNVLLFLTMGAFANFEIDRGAREAFLANSKLREAQAKTEEMLYNMLPEAVAQRLRDGEAVADSFADISVIFVDIVGFSVLSKRLSPGHLVHVLNQFFTIADDCTEKFGVEKVKTIGDAYLAVSGGTASASHGAREAVEFALALLREVEALSDASNLNLQIRVGIHSGSVVGGVIGSSKLAYDYWGDTMNIASRVEGAALPNGIAVSSSVYYRCHDAFDFEGPDTIMLKGIGETEIYRLSRRD